MNKRGFTLVELLAVIAIIGILSLVVVPNVMNISKNVNIRLAEEKKDLIVSAGELYGTNNPDIFGGTDIVYVSVQKLIDAEYLEIDTKHGEMNCNTKCDIDGGCIGNPACEEGASGLDGKAFFNSVDVKLTKKSVGIVGEISDDNGEIFSKTETLVDKVCRGFDSIVDSKKRSYTGKSLEDGKQCGCVLDGDENPVKENGKVILKDIDGNVVTGCILVSNRTDGNIDNWLKYGSKEANWRVIGLYNVNGDIAAKMITNSLIEE